MKPYYYLFGLRIPTYGTMIVLALCFSNLWIYFERKDKGDFDNIILLECFGALGAIVGSKLLFLLVNFAQIDWSRFFEREYFQMIMNSGFVFLGALLGGISAIILSEKMHITKDAWKTLNEIVFVIPAGHAIGRIGCFCAGCCYGIPYSGPMAVTFPAESLGPSGISVFPVQLLEAVLLAALSFFLYRLHKKGTPDLMLWYLALYCFMRFFIEMLRGDDLERGTMFLSTSQWISLITITVIILYRILYKKQSDQNTPISS